MKGKPSKTKIMWSRGNANKDNRSKLVGKTFFKEVFKT